VAQDGVFSEIALRPLLTPLLHSDIIAHALAIQGLPELTDQHNTVKSLSSGNNRKNIFKNPSSLDFKIRTFLIDQSRVDIKLP
jgi:hypothetical protein